MAGSSIGFASFNSDEEGIRAIARQLSIYQRRDHIDAGQGWVRVEPFGGGHVH